MKYKKSIVTFIDILGFRDLVESKSPNEVNKILKLLAYFGDDTDNEYKRYLKLKVITFSDSIIRVRETGVANALFYELLDLVHIQSELMGNGILIRGGVALGDVYATSKKIFGPGFVQAYELESEFAIYPRIVLSPSLLIAFQCGELKAHSYHDVRYEEEYVRSLLARGDDGFWFVDYLRAFQTELDDESCYPELLARQKSIVLSFADRAKLRGSRISRLVAKVNWLANYHNGVVDSAPKSHIEGIGANRGDLKITSAEVQTLIELRENLYE